MNKKKKAKDMFKELGYKISSNKNDKFQYKHLEYWRWDFCDYISINFNLDAKTFEKYSGYDNESVSITLEENKAIQQQIKELGW